MGADNGYGFHSTLYNGCNYLSLLGLNSIHVSKMAQDRSFYVTITKLHMFGGEKCYDNFLFWSITAFVRLQGFFKLPCRNTTINWLIHPNLIPHELMKCYSIYSILLKNLLNCQRAFAARSHRVTEYLNGNLILNSDSSVIIKAPLNKVHGDAETKICSWCFLHCTPAAMFPREPECTQA